MAGRSLVDLSRALVDIDSTTGREGAACAFLASELRSRGFRVVEQPVCDGRFNVLALLDPAPDASCSRPTSTASRPSSRAASRTVSCYGRGACDAKGALAAQVMAAERLREAGQEKVGLLFVVGEERGSDGALAANELPPGRALPRERRAHGEPPRPRRPAASCASSSGHGPRGALVAAGAGRERDRRPDRRARRAAADPAAGRPGARPHLLLDRPHLGRHRPERDLALTRRPRLLFRTVGPGKDVLDVPGPARRRAWRSSSCSRSRR